LIAFHLMRIAACGNPISQLLRFRFRIGTMGSMCWLFP